MDELGSQTADEASRGFIKVARRSASADVQAQLVGLIESGRLKVNERLPSEIELARSFGVSRPVIREALMSLRALGLTTSRTGKGTFVVASQSPSALLLGRYSATHLNEVRRYLEVPSARLAAVRRSEEDVERLGEALADMERTEDASSRNKLDASFHMAIAFATGNPLFVRLVEDLRTILEEHSLAVSIAPQRRQRASAEHRAIYEAILRRDAPAAAEAMSAHLDAVDACLAELGRERLNGAAPPSP